MAVYNPSLTLSQIFDRIDRNPAYQNFVVQVRTGGPAGRPNSGNDIPPFDSCTGFYKSLGKMPVPCFDAIPMVHNDHQTVSASTVGDKQQAAERWQAVRALVTEREDEIHRVFDVYLFLNSMQRKFRFR